MSNKKDYTLKEQGESLAATDYAIVLRSGRIVLPGPGGFYWYAAGGRQLGSVHSMDWVAREMSAGALGGVAATAEFGKAETTIEFIPLASIDTVVKRSELEEIAPVGLHVAGPYR